MSSKAAAAVVILAGGQGRRAGGPKALKSLFGQPLWRVMAQHFSSTGLEPVLAVLHPSAMPAAGDLELAGVEVLAADPEAPMFASLQCGLQQVPDGLSVFIHPVDGGLPTLAVIAALQSAHAQSVLENRHFDVWQPRIHSGQHEGRRGHPVLLAADYWPKLLLLDPATARLDRVLAALPASRRAELPWSDPAILANFNTDGLSV
jgi:CTP:molybdopterin cytidylyltransferase MocA